MNGAENPGQGGPPGRGRGGRGGMGGPPRGGMGGPPGGPSLLKAPAMRGGPSGPR